MSGRAQQPQTRAAGARLDLLQHAPSSDRTSPKQGRFTWRYILTAADGPSIRKPHGNLSETPPPRGPYHLLAASALRRMGLIGVAQGCRHGYRWFEAHSLPWSRIGVDPLTWSHCGARGWCWGRRGTKRWLALVRMICCRLTLPSKDSGVCAASPGQPARNAVSQWRQAAAPRHGGLGQAPCLPGGRPSEYGVRGQMQ